MVFVKVCWSWCFMVPIPMTRISERIAATIQRWVGAGLGLHQAGLTNVLASFQEDYHSALELIKIDVQLPHSLVIVVVFEKARVSRAVVWLSTKAAFAKCGSRVSRWFLFWNHFDKMFGRGAPTVPQVTVVFHHTRHIFHRLQATSNHREFLIEQLRNFATKLKKIPFKKISIKLNSVVMSESQNLVRCSYFGSHQWWLRRGIVRPKYSSIPFRGYGSENLACLCSQLRTLFKM